MAENNANDRADKDDRAENKVPELSLGEKRVRTSFNPGQNGMVDSIKQKTAELINMCESLFSQDPRLASIAMTKYEEAAMWAVKAATATALKAEAPTGMSTNQAPGGAGYVPPKQADAVGKEPEDEK